MFIVWLNVIHLVSVFAVQNAWRVSRADSSTAVLKSAELMEHSVQRVWQRWATQTD